MATIYILIASLMAASVNFCLRKNAEQQKSANGYLTLYFVSSFIISFFLAEVSFENFRFVMPSIGAIAGTLNFIMMGILSLAIQSGASGLTFAFQNSASIFPSVLLFFIFGAPFGFSMNSFIILGLCLVLAGLFLSSRAQNKNTEPNQTNEKTAARSSFGKWLCYVIAVFGIQGMILTLFQWRCLLLSDNIPDHPLIFWKCHAQEDAWFMPGFFLIPGILQAVFFALYEKRWFTLREALLGMAGGLFNGGSTYFLLMGTKYAGAGEKMILFPLFAVTVIFLCNLWSKVAYGEKIYWPGMALCLGGVFVGSLVI